MTDQFFTTSDGARLFTRMLGQNETKTPVIVLHGAPGAHTHAAAEAGYGFLQTDRRVLVFDARGSGVSDDLGPLNHARWAEDVEELRIGFGFDKLILAAHSFGGFVALQYAINYKSRVAALILEDTSAESVSIVRCVEHFIKAAPAHIDRLRLRRMVTGTLHDEEDFVGSMLDLATLTASTASKASPPVGSHGALRLRTKTHNCAFRDDFPDYDIRSRLHEIRCPSFVAVGALDPVMPVECGKELAANIPDAELVMFPRSGHNPSVEESAAFRAEVLRFLAACSAT